MADTLTARAVVDYRDVNGYIHDGRIFYRTEEEVRKILKEHGAEFLAIRFQFKCECGMWMDQTQSHCFGCNRRNPSKCYFEIG